MVRRLNGVIRRIQFNRYIQGAVDGFRLDPLRCQLDAALRRGDTGPADPGKH